VLSTKNVTKPVKTATITEHESAGTHPAAFSHNQDPERTKLSRFVMWCLGTSIGRRPTARGLAVVAYGRVSQIMSVR
jgi:hypothetical protein